MRAKLPFRETGHLLTCVASVQTHQINYLRIQQLRQASATLDAQIRDTLSSLATTRKDIVTTHTKSFPDGPNYPIEYDELLSYARRISKTTLPPAGTIKSVATMSGVQTPAPDSQPQSAMTPTVPTPSPAPVNGVSQAGSELPTQQTTTSANISLPEGMTQFLNPLSGQIFFPWPTEDKIRSGSLASNQALIEKGIDPKGYDPADEEERKQKEVVERKEREEREKLEHEERERRAREERERERRERELQREREQEAWRRASVAGDSVIPAPVARNNAGAGEKKQFQFVNLDDLDDDDDD